jgi:hypothetical protein
MTPHFLEVLDGLLLGAARLVSGHGTAALVITRRRNPVSWLLQVSELLARVGIESTHDGRCLRTKSYFELRAVYERWYRRRGNMSKHVPHDVRLTPVALAYWFSSAGATINKGYVIRFATRHFSWACVEQLAKHLHDMYAWAPELGEDKGPILKLVRNGDRQQFRGIVMPHILPVVQGRLVVRVSKPCTPKEALRRRRPRVLDASHASSIRTRAENGERYATIAQDVGVGERHIGKIARGASWAINGGVAPIRRRRTRKAQAEVMTE